MADTSAVPIACSNIGSEGRLSCCYANDQNNAICEDLFGGSSFLANGCLTGNCINDCSPRKLYNSTLQETSMGTGQRPIAKYMACANIPSIAGYINQNVLSSNITNSIQGFISSHTTDDSLRNVTSAVTDCISSNCRASRNSKSCYTDYCSPVRLLRNNTSPDLEAINTCLNTLCGGGVKYLPWADADIIGIGVFISYVMQLIFIGCLWLGFLIFAIRQRKNRQPQRPPNPGEHYKIGTNLLSSFHASQCFFSATLMIASLNYGIYTPSMLVTFLLIPLATNSILPIIFAYLLLLYHKKSSTGTTLLTLTVYVLSSVVYWSLYTQLIPLGNSITAEEIYQNFRFKLSAIPACGGFSGLSICDVNGVSSPALFNAGNASMRLKVITPMIWGYSTLILLIYWYIKFIGGALGKLNILWIAEELHMIDPKGWTFGQIVAVTVWIPPLLEYAYCEVKEVIRDWRGKRGGSEEQKNS
ncbi:hypothetical protein BKA61DRAFT_740098 [Leptodontidium sp. MPI-SDFR-AT-0119]|nr:hypothetical protein BKA61DRAFT_740098 [Leptodontidium sp. MPI-SDFR-AT-0119]